MQIKSYFLPKIKVKRSKCRLLQFLFGAIRVNLFKWQFLFHSTSSTDLEPLTHLFPELKQLFSNKLEIRAALISPVYRYLYYMVYRGNAKAFMKMANMSRRIWGMHVL